MAGAGTVVIRILGDATGLNAVLGESEAKLGGLGEVAGKAFTGVAIVGVAIGAMLLDIGVKFEEAFNTIRRETGATGPQLHELEDNFKNVVSTVPAKFGDAAEAVSKLHQILGLSGSALEKESEQVLELNRITGGDLATTLTGVTGLFSNWQVATKDQSGQLDMLFRASQISGTGVQTLMEQVQTSGAVFRGANFSLSETTGMLAMFDKAGLNTDAVVAALKKGLATFAKEGKDPREALMGIIGELQKAPNAVKTMQDAFAAFGARGGQQLIDAVKTGRINFQDMMKTIAAGSDTIRKAGDDTMTLKDRFELLKNKAFVELEPIASRFLGLLVKGFGEIGPAIEHVRKFVTQFVADWNNGTDRIGVGASKIKSVVQDIGTFLGLVFSEIRGFIGQFVDDWNNGTDKSGGAATKIKEIFGQVWATLKSGFEAARAMITVAVQVIIYLWDHFGSYILNSLKIVWNSILGVIKATLEIVKGIWDVFAGVFTGDFSKVWNGIKGIFGGAWDGIKTIFSGALDLIWNQLSGWFHAVELGFGAVWDAIKGTVLDGVNTVIEYFTYLPRKALELVGDLLSAGEKMGGAIITGIKSGMAAIADTVGDVANAIGNAFIDGWNAVAGAIDDLIPNKIGFDTPFGFVGIDLPDNPLPRNIPHLYTGAIAASPMLAVVGDTPGQSEIVTPENLMRKIVDEALAGSGGGGMTSHLHIHGDVWDPQTVHRILDERDRQLLRQLRTRKKG